MNSTFLLFMFKNIFKDIGFTCLTGSDIVNSIKFDHMTSLARLDLSNSSGDNKLFSNLLNQCITLKSLNLSYCLKVTDEMFMMATLNSKLEELNLSFIKQVIIAEEKS